MNGCPKKVVVFLLSSLFLISCSADRSYDRDLMNESIVFGSAGEEMKGAYFEAEIDTTSEWSKKIREAKPNSVVACIKNRHFPPGGFYKLYGTRVDGVSAEIGKVISTEKGELMLELQGNVPLPLENHYFIFSGFAKGEEMYYTLVALDGKSCLTTSMGSNSIRALAVDGALAAMKLKDQKGSMFTLEGKNFTPEEKITMTVTYADQTMSCPELVKLDGKWHSILLIDLKKYPSGSGTFEIERQTGEVLSGEFLFGKDIKKSIQ